MHKVTTMKKTKGLKVITSLIMAVMMLFSTTPITAMAATCTTKNNHSIDCGDVDGWFISVDKLQEYVDGVVDEWREKRRNGEITLCEYNYYAPCGYECWSCAYCGKWTGNFKYNDTNIKTCQWDNGVVVTAATCTSTGIKKYTCTVCNGTKTETIPKTAHSYKTTVESPDNAVHICTACGDEQKCNSSETGSYNEHTVSKATLKNNGIITDSTYCRYCNLKLSEKNKTINKIKTVSLGKNTYNYNGKIKTPSVAVKDSKGNKLIKNTDYTVSYPNGRKAVGTYAVKITFKGNYKGSKTLKFKILPKGTKLSSVKPKKQSATVKWKKQTKQITGYQIQYSISKKFKSAKSLYIKKAKTTKTTIKKLKTGKKYYFRIRTYKVVKGKKYYSSWSKTMAVKI